MILRRLSQSLKEQNWTAIVIEFILLVVGVFLGIQVANWNVERETKQKAAVFTERLKADLRHEAFFYQYFIEYNRDVLAAAENAVNALTGKTPLSDEQLLINAYRATQYKPTAALPRQLRRDDLDRQHRANQRPEAAPDCNADL